MFGLGRRCINPGMPISLAGYFNARMWDKILDDIEVRVLALRSGRAWATLVQFDLVNVSQELADAVYAAVASAGIKELSPANIIITATHSHTAPEIRSGKPGANPQYLPFAAAQALAAIQEALAGMQTGALAGGMTSDHRFIFNRRYWMKTGEVVTNPGKLNPEIDRPEGEIDPEIPLLAITQNGKIRILIANIVNHSDTIGGNGVSADWPGFLRRRLENQLGAGSMVLPLIGAAGNINHFDVRTATNQTCYAEAERIGEGYAATIAPALSRLQPLPDCRLRTCGATVTAAPRAIPPAELAEARALLERLKDIPDATRGGTLTSEDLAKKSPVALKHFALRTAAMAEFNEPVIFKLVGIFLGATAALISLPGEPFVEIGLDLRKRIFAGRLTMVLEQCNGTGNVNIAGGYIPNEWNYGRGGYETTPRSNPYAVDTAGKLLAAWRALALKIKVQPIL